jgi:hypothetical protein
VKSAVRARDTVMRLCARLGLGLELLGLHVPQLARAVARAGDRSRFAVLCVAYDAGDALVVDGLEDHGDETDRRLEGGRMGGRCRTNLEKYSRSP